MGRNDDEDNCSKNRVIMRFYKINQIICYEKKKNKYKKKRKKVVLK